jgi:hypothetical protein
VVNWYRGYGATTSSHLGRKPLCPPPSTPEALHVKRNESLPVARNGSGREMDHKFRLKNPTSS